MFRFLRKKNIIDTDLEQKIEEEIREAVLQRERALEETRRRAGEETIALNALKEVSDLPDSEIDRIAGEIRARYTAESRERILKKAPGPAKRSWHFLLASIGLIVVCGFIVVLVLVFKTVRENSFQMVFHFRSREERTTTPDPLGNKPVPSISELSGLSDRDRDLLEAVKNGLIEAVTFLIDSGANVNTADKAGRSALFLAVMNGNEAIAKLLVNRRSDVNTPAQDGSTPLMQAVKRGDTEISRFLLERKANISPKDRSGRSAIVWAALSGQSALVESLYRRGGQLHEKHAGVTLEMILNLIKQPHPDSELLTALLVPDSDVDARDNEGRTALHKASGYGKPETAGILLELGADVNARDRYGSTALHSAAYGGHTLLAELLLDHGADVNIRGKYGYTPLLAAADGRARIDFFKLLLSRGADVNARSASGNTALVYARSRGKSDVEEFLKSGRHYRIAVPSLQCPIFALR